MREPRKLNGMPVEFVCWTVQYNRDRLAYEEHPIRHGSRKLSFDEAHPEHWWCEPLKDRLCQEYTPRPNDMCPTCNRVQYEWQREHFQARRRNSASEAEPEPARRGRRGQDRRA